MTVRAAMAGVASALGTGSVSGALGLPGFGAQPAEEDWILSPPQVEGGGWSVGRTGVALPGGGGEIDSFMHAIGLKESGGNYRAVGPMTKYGRPVGKYQILDRNWAAWAAEAGIPGASWRNPEAQERVARFKMMQYFQRFGRWDAVAVAWFAGPARAAQYIKSPNSVANLSDVLGTSVARYVRDVTANMRTVGYAQGPVGAGARVAPPGGMWSPEAIGAAGSRIAEVFGLRMTSHQRSPGRNRRVGGAKRSDHLWGGAVDLAGSREQIMAAAKWAEQFTGPNGPFRIVLHPGNDPKGHDDHLHISWKRGATQPFQLPGGPALYPSFQINRVGYPNIGRARTPVAAAMLGVRRALSTTATRPRSVGGMTTGGVFA